MNIKRVLVQALVRAIITSAEAALAGFAWWLLVGRPYFEAFVAVWVVEAGVAAALASRDATRKAAAKL